LLIGRENLNRAVHGDMVVVEVLAEAKWGVEGDEVVDQEGMRRSVNLFANIEPFASHTQKR
jgi:exosome complex exonuclease DIS3/RRP44